jgi:biopolymer transport protein ExbB
MEVYSTIVSFFQEGGLFMYPIVLIFALGLAIAVERYLFLTVTTTKNKVLCKKVTPYQRSVNFTAAA